MIQANCWFNNLDLHFKKKKQWKVCKNRLNKYIELEMFKYYNIKDPRNT